VVSGMWCAPTRRRCQGGRRERQSGTVREGENPANWNGGGANASVLVLGEWGVECGGGREREWSGHGDGYDDSGRGSGLAMVMGVMRMGVMVIGRRVCEVVIAQRVLEMI
jgi:hypothetical protein